MIKSALLFSNNDPILQSLFELAAKQSTSVEISAAGLELEHSILGGLWDWEMFKTETNSSRQKVTKGQTISFNFSLQKMSEENSEDFLLIAGSFAKLKSAAKSLLESVDKCETELTKTAHSQGGMVYLQAVKWEVTQWLEASILETICCENLVFIFQNINRRKLTSAVPSKGRNLVPKILSLSSIQNDFSQDPAELCESVGTSSGTFANVHLYRNFMNARHQFLSEMSEGSEGVFEGQKYKAMVRALCSLQFRNDFFARGTSVCNFSFQNQTQVDGVLNSGYERFWSNTALEMTHGSQLRLAYFEFRYAMREIQRTVSSNEFIFCRLWKRAMEFETFLISQPLFTCFAAGLFEFKIPPLLPTKVVTVSGLLCLGSEAMAASFAKRLWGRFPLEGYIYACDGNLDGIDDAAASEEEPGQEPGDKKFENDGAQAQHALKPTDKAISPEPDDSELKVGRYGKTQKQHAPPREAVRKLIG